MKKKVYIFLFIAFLLTCIIVVQVIYLRSEQRKIDLKFRNEFQAFISKFPTIDEKLLVTKRDLMQIRENSPLRLGNLNKFLISKAYNFGENGFDAESQYFPLFKIRQGEELAIGYFRMIGNHQDIAEVYYCSSHAVPYTGNRIVQNILLDKIKTDTIIRVNSDYIITTFFREDVAWESITEIDDEDTVRFEQLVNFEENGAKDLEILLEN